MLYAIVAVLALILDQALKYWTTVNIVVDSGTVNLFPGFLHLANVHNTGAAFSFLSGARWFFVVLCIVFVLIVIYALAKDLIRHPVCRWAAVLVMAGAIGNCIDRIVCGYVVDMLEFDFLFFKHPFPVFNVADIYITLGVIIFCVAMLLEKPAEKQKAGAVPATTAVKPQEKKPRSRRRQKVVVPNFEKRVQSAVPTVDPADPFAEWEKRAKEREIQKEISAQPPQSTVYTQPVVPTAPTAPTASVAPVTPATPVERPAAPKASAADEFDLDSILAEFKDS